MPGDNRTQIVLGALAFAGVLGAAVFNNWGVLSGTEKPKPPASTASGATTGAPASSQTITGNGNLQISGSNNVVNPLPQPKACRDKTHGVERYVRIFEVERTSPWMGGGFSQEPWCSQVIGELRGQHPESEFDVLVMSEDSRSACAPLNCPQYRYHCRVRVKAEPVYVEKLSSVCR